MSELPVVASSAAHASWAAASEDMDTLIFDAPKLARRLSVSEAHQQPILQLDLAEALTTRKITRSQFASLCILCGCGYTSTIRGIEPENASHSVRVSLASRSMAVSKHA